MILVTVGSQLPFDRLISAVDLWASTHRRTDVLAQAGKSNVQGKAIRCVTTVTPHEMEELISTCEIVVAHAGMGTILTALQYGKPLVLLPRRAALRETRSDHQVATAQWLTGRPGVFVARTEQELDRCIDAALASGSAPQRLEDGASCELLSRLEAFIDQA